MQTQILLMGNTQTLVHVKYCDKIPQPCGAHDVSVDEGGSVHRTGFHSILYLCNLKGNT